MTARISNICRSFARALRLSSMAAPGPAVAPAPDPMAQYVQHQAQQVAIQQCAAWEAANNNSIPQLASYDDPEAVRNWTTAIEQRIAPRAVAYKTGATPAGHAETYACLKGTHAGANEHALAVDWLRQYIDPSLVNTLIDAGLIVPSDETPPPKEAQVLWEFLRLGPPDCDSDCVARP